MDFAKNNENFVIKNVLFYFYKNEPSDAYICKKLCVGSHIYIKIIYTRTL